jgi:hypothetical protein
MGSYWKEKYVQIYFPRVMAALRAGRRVRKVFNNKAKAAAIEWAWNNKRDLFTDLKKIPTSFDAPCYVVTADDLRLVEWCGKIPYLGQITKWLPARDFGANVPKPDMWLDRFATYSGECVLPMCKRLARASGDRIAVVDLVLWYAGSRGLVELPTSKKPRGKLSCKGRPLV